MPEPTTTPVVAPTTAQYEALVAPPPERFGPVQCFDYQRSCWEPDTAPGLESLRSRIPQDRKLFLLVPPQPVLASKADLDALISRLSYRGNAGVNYLDPQYLTDEVAVPEGPYLLTEVEDGRASLGIAPRDAKVQLATAHRSPLTWWEVFCLYRCFGSAILGHHNVWCGGSRFESRGVPYFYLNDGQLEFSNFFWGINTYPKWGSASCGRRVAA